jgi:hypothetical protein
LSYFWKPATLTDKTVKSHTTSIVFDSIVKQLTPTAEQGVPVAVEGVDVCFFDLGAKFMQPVYCFTAKLHPNSNGTGNATASPTRLLGYIPIGSQSPEAVPELSKHPKHLTDPTTPKDEDGHGHGHEHGHERRHKHKHGHGGFYGGSRKGRLPNILISRYIVRADSLEWVNNANNFLSSLQNPGGIGPQANFVDHQYFWVQPFEFMTRKNGFINSVHVAEAEVHGNWHVFWTFKNFGDMVQLSDIPSEGYGGDGGGRLAYWILHSCQVIPTPTDYSAADQHLTFDDWFPIFNGMHAVVGYRTEMWIADRVMPTFGRSISQKAPFVSSWLQAIHDNTSDYLPNGQPTLYLDNNRHINEPMGRPTAVVVCGHEDDTVVQVENLGKPRCLREFWYDN